MKNNNEHLDLFSGIGGFALAARWAGFQTVQFIENELYCQKVLQKNFPGVPIHGDIHDFKANKHLGIRLLTGGFPCQPYSQAGQRRGSEDDRALWPEMFRIICECRPHFILGENVVGIVQMELDTVLSDLEGEGYTCQSFVVPACGKDARHRRDRVWVLAHSQHGTDRTKQRPEGEENCIQGISGSSGCSRMSGGTGGNTEALAYSDSGFSDRENEEIFTGRNSPDNGSERENVAYSECNTEGTTHRSDSRFSGNGWEEQNICEWNQVGSNLGNGSEDVSNSKGKRVEGCWSGWEQESHTHGQEGLPLCEGERPQPTIWDTEPDVGRVAHGIPRRVDRLKGLGNAIVPQVAYEFLRLLRI